MPELLRIGITCYPSLGGSGVVATELGKLLAEKGHQVHFITHSMPFRLGQFQQNIYYHEVEVTDYYVLRYPPYDLSLASKMAEVATLHQLDLLHVHYAIPHAVCAYLAKEIVGDHLKIVTTLHGTDITILGQNESTRELIRLAIHKSDAVTAVSNYLIQRTQQLFGIERNIERIYNFIDQRVYFPRDSESQRRQFAPNGEKIMMHISNFRPVKRVMDVVAIFHQVRKSIPCKLLLVGEGPDLSKVHQEIVRLGLQDDVFFLGKQNDVAQTLSVADLLLLPSENESFGLVALEAMACGVPTIATDSGGIPELILHNDTGFLAPIGQTAEMAHYALELLTNDELYAHMVKACIDRATSLFDSRTMMERYEQVYYDVLGRK